MKVRDKVDSDHHPLELWVKGETKKERKKEKSEK